MGWNDHMDDGDDVSNLPPQARGNVSDTDGPFDPDDGCLRQAEPAQRRVAMRAWFLARFCDPAHETPYNGREGGYLFVNGGPYNPSDELRERFGDVVDGDAIQEVVDEMHAEVGDQWAPVRYDRPDDYDDRFDLELVASEEPLRRIRQRLDDCKRVLQLQGDSDAIALAERLVFGAVISALEAFLWETAQHWINAREGALRECVTKLPVFRDEPIKLGDVFNRHEGIREHVKAYLQNLVWHRWDKVGALYKTGLGVTLPGVKPFDEALVKRHDIVHRSGHDKAGQPVIVKREEIEALSVAVVEFAVELERRLADRFGDASSGTTAPDF